MFADWQLSMRVKRDPQTLNLLHRSSQTEEPHWAPTLLFPLIWTSAGVGLSLCADQRESIKQTREHRKEPEVSAERCRHAVIFIIIMLFSYLDFACTLIADGSGAGSSERDTTCDCRRSEFFHIKLEKCFFVHVFISAECVWTSHCCAQEQTQTDVCLSVTAQCCGACSPQTVTVSETITEVIEKQCSLEMFPLIKPSTDSFTRTCSGLTRGLWPYVWHHTLDAFMTPEPWNKWLKTEHLIYLINLLT